MLVPIAIGLWAFSLICDLVQRFGSTNPNWEVVAWYTLVGGIVRALVAAVPGFIDMLSLPWHTKRIALLRMAINLMGVSGWLGGKLVYVHGVAVEPARSDAARAAHK